jgi:hypothetical protein
VALKSPQYGKFGRKVVSVESARNKKKKIQYKRNSPIVEHQSANHSFLLLEDSKGKICGRSGCKTCGKCTNKQFEPKSGIKRKNQSVVRKKKNVDE